MARILVIGSHPDSFVNFRYDMLRDMAAEHEVFACAPAAPKTVVDRLAEINVKYLDVYMARTGLNPLVDIKTVRELHRICKEIKPDKVISYTAKPVIYGSLAAKFARVPEVYSMITGVGSFFIHNDIKSLIIRKIMSLLYRVSLAGNKKVFFQNPDDVDDFAKNKIFRDPSRTVFINGSGVNVQHFHPQPLPEAPTFLMISRFIKAKGILEYLDAARSIKNKYSQVRCLLVGWFEDKEEALGPDVLQAYVDDQSIEYLGKLDDVRPALARTSVYVLPSYREGTPKSVLEAMACGRAIITTDVPGCRETVTDNGLLVPARSANELVLAMEKFILQPHLVAEMGRRSRTIAEERFAVEKVNKVILNTMGLSHA